MKDKFLIGLLFSMIVSISIKAQSKASNFPEIGKRCPSFSLSNVNFYHKDQIELKDFNGTALILDFFSTGCTACFQSFPKINKLKKEFADKLQVILVGYEDMYIKSAYEKYMGKYDLQLPVVYTKEIFEKFGVSGVPHVIWIDKKGIIKAITSSRELTQPNIEKFLDGKPFEYVDLSYAANYQRKMSLVKKESILDNDESVLYKSVLSGWDKNTRQRVPGIGPLQVKNGNIEIRGATVQWLYNIAFWGIAQWQYRDSFYNTVSQQPILEIRDSSIFEFNFASGENIYNYSLNVPMTGCTPERIMNVMQQDLQNYFGFDVTVESRRIPCWELVATDEAKIKLKSKEDVPVYSDTARNSELNIKGSLVGYELRNCPVKLLMTLIAANHQSEPPFIDETGINFNIDIEIDAMMTDLSDIIKGLQKSGLNLIKVQREMKVLVIKEPVKRESNYLLQ